jgi:restriction system protein
MAATILILGAIFAIRIVPALRRRPNFRDGKRRPGPQEAPVSAPPQSPGTTSHPESAPMARNSTPPPPRPTAWNLDLLRALEWKRFEEVCEGVWSLTGYPARATPLGPDGGVDVIIADKSDPATVFAIVQCKSWTSNVVGVEKVRALWGAKDHFKARLAVLYGLSGFSEDARAFANGKDLKLISGDELLRQIQSLPEVDQQALLADVTRGDYTTPSCPQCGTKMSLHPGRDGRPGFWGCPEFPRCRPTPIPVRNAAGEA